MKKPWWAGWDVAFFLMLLAYPLLPALNDQLFALTGRSIGDRMAELFIFAIVALGLNVAVGYVGLLHLGIAAFFGIGAYVTGILTVPAYPFEVGFYVALVAGALAAAMLGGLIGAPLLRLRGDYLALVTLGFGEVVKYTIKNLDAITAGTRGLNPVPPPMVPGVDANLWAADYRPFYYLSLVILAAVYVVLRMLERSKLGRAWIAVREDELAASCMGLNTARLKLSAFVLAAGIAGLAGVLYATKITSTADPNSYDFNRSITLLCCIILGGIASRPGVLLGVLLLVGFDSVLAPIIDDAVQRCRNDAGTAVLWDSFVVPPKFERFVTFSNWKLFVFGMVLILMMRFRPEGLLPSNRVKDELNRGGVA